MIALPRSNTPGLHPELVIKIIGLGGAGANALDRIQLDGFDGAELIAMNTDSQSLAGSVAPVKVQLGRQTTRGLGTGGDPELGYAAAEEACDEVRSAIDGASLVFVCVGLGGGSGSGAAPLVANYARQQGALVVAFVTLPFTFEGRRRLAQAEEALASLRQQADVVICFENDKMGDAVSPRAGIQEAFAAADHTISQSVRAVAAILQRRGLIHAGLDEITTILRAQNARCLFGVGEADGDNRAHAALERALRNPLMDRGRLLSDVSQLLVHVAGGPTMTLNEVTLLMEELNRHISDTTRLLFSTAVDPRLGNKMSVTILSSLAAGAAEAAPAPVARVVPAPAPIPVPAPVSAPVSVAAPPVIEPPLIQAEEPAPAPMVRRVRTAPAPIRPAPAPIPVEPEPEPEIIAPAAALVRPAPIITAPVPVPVPVAPAPAPAPAPTVAPVPEPADEGKVAAKGPKTAAAATGKPRTAREEKQEQMQFEPVNRGRFEKSEPTIVDGQDLDIPAFMRMNVRVK